MESFENGRSENAVRGTAIGELPSAETQREGDAVVVLPQYIIAILKKEWAVGLPMKSALFFFGHRPNFFLMIEKTLVISVIMSEKVD